MSLDQTLRKIHELLDQYQLWRTTEQVAQQDIDDAQARLAAAELRLREAKAAHKDVAARVNAVEDELAEVVERYTAPTAMLYLTNDVK